MATNNAEYAYHTPTGAAYTPPDADPTMEGQPPNQDAETHDVVRDQSRLGGVRALNLPDRGA